MADGLAFNSDLSRYEWQQDGHTVFAVVERRGEVLAILHVEAPTALRGSGAAGRFMQLLMEHLQQEHQKVLPICGYAVAWIRKHKEFHPLLAA